ncbi:MULTISPECIES: winged helix-turn-helix transcriptional regulator [unclassified Streptomyces]|uniref:winged helix-turn-helix transcriptional regulator n=1 Tax=unclassified Streptomyces TaxID=2593676 RepID=UPI0033C414D5
MTGTIRSIAPLTDDVDSPDGIDLSALPVHLLSTTGLKTDGSSFLRSAGLDPEHVRTLYEAGAEAPPIVVHRRTMRVVDGRHRLCAARLRGEEYIAARLVDGEDEDIFLLAVKLNMRHGLPLSRDDRMAAARRIIRGHPDWSDRRIARASGLSDKTVAAVRRSAGDLAETGTRVGRDGRARPRQTAEARIRAAELLRDNPRISLRELASAAGISLGTARDVKVRVLRGADPVPDGQRRPRASQGPPAPSAEPLTAPLDPAERQRAIARLARDPSLRQTETGRTVLRILAVHSLGAAELERLARAVPPHGVDAVLTLARACADDWSRFVRRLESGALVGPAEGRRRP